MKQVEVTAYDDLDWTEKQERTRADREVRVELVLDLTEEHAVELERLLERYRAAAPPPSKRGLRPAHGRRGSGPGLSEAHQRNLAEAAWHEEQGLPFKRSDRGALTFPKASHRAYLAHLAEVSS